MMKNFIYFILFMIASINLACAEPLDVKGFKNFTWGMTGDDIKAAAPSEVVKLAVRYIPENRKTYTDYEIPDYVVNDVHFKVSFIMDAKNDKLNRVSLQSGLSAIDFESFELLLVKKYGEPKIKKIKPGKSLRTRNIVWVFKTTSIELDFLEFSIGTSTLWMSYSPSVTEESDKL